MKKKTGGLWRKIEADLTRHVAEFKALLLDCLVAELGPNWIEGNYQLVFAEVRKQFDEFPSWGTDVEMEVVQEATAK